MEQSTKKVLVLKTKESKPVAQTAATIARDSFLRDTTRFSHAATYGRYSN